MCGIAGVVRIVGDEPVDGAVVNRMLDALAHRGPDGRGVVAVGPAAIGAVRLAVRDTSERGAQPMSTAHGRHHVVHNGELYDLPDLRRLVRAPLRSQSDTEVLLHLLAERGDDTWARLNGMFASAWWDAQRQRLVLARDRFGEKPVFWARYEGCLLFASEEKALFAAGVPAEFDHDSWAELLAFRFVAGSRTPYVGVQRLLPGHTLEVCDGQIRTDPWHHLVPTTGGDLRELLAQAVDRRLAADVPVGVIISGGLDSSGIAALAAQQKGQDLPAYTVSYPGDANDETRHARAVASHLGLDLREIVVPPADVPTLFEEATWLRGEPMAISPSAHLLALARVAREEVTVVLSGEGADELFGGYAHFRLHRYPRLTTAVGQVVRNARSGRAELLARRARRPPDRRISLSDALELAGRDWDDVPFAYRDAAATGSTHALRRALRYDQQTYLASVLATADRSTMGAGLEGRAPFLDPDVADHAAGLEPRELFARGIGKAPLRRALHADLPPSILRRTKRGWTAPWQRYLREVPSLRDRVRSLPSQALIQDAPLDHAAVALAVNSFLEGGAGGDFSLVWALVRISVWHDVCVLGQRGVLV